MLAQGGDDVRQGVHDKGLAAAVGDGIDHQRQGEHMIEVGMGQEDMVDGSQFAHRQFGNATAGVKQDVVVDEEGSGAQMGSKPFPVEIDFSTYMTCGGTTARH